MKFLGNLLVRERVIFCADSPVSLMYFSVPTFQVLIAVFIPENEPGEEIKGSDETSFL